MNRAVAVSRLFMIPPDRWDYADPSDSLKTLLGEFGSAQAVVEMLKDPFCHPAAERLVLAELERRLESEFGGDVWALVERAEEFGVELNEHIQFVIDALTERADELKLGPAA